MGKNKRKHPDIEEVLGRPWCYYCERDFDDLKILINHQKAKHYKCERCGRRLNTAGGLAVHMTQVHKETLTIIENALPNRAGLEVEIFGMEGIPEEIAQSHKQRVLQQYAQAEAERKAASGNNDESGGNASKKPKFEAASDLKKRLAEHKARKAAEEAPAINGSGQNTPTAVSDRVQSPPNYPPQAMQNFQQPQPAPVTAAPPNSNPYTQYTQSYGGPSHDQGPPFQHHQQPPQSFPPPQHQPPFQPQQPTYGPPMAMPQYPNNPPYGPPQQYQPPIGHGFGQPPFQNSPPPFQNGPTQYHNGPPQFHNGPQFHQGPPQPYGMGSPPPYQQGPYQPPMNHAPPGNGMNPGNGMPHRPTNFSSPPGLPQRPSFAAPPVNAQEMQQMHHGQFRASPGQPDNGSDHQQQMMQVNGGPTASVSGTVSPNPQISAPGQLAAPSVNVTSLDELVSGAAKEADKAAAAGKTRATELKSADASEEKKVKKEKDKHARLVYSDNEISPEEKMSQMSRYAFARAG